MKTLPRILPVATIVSIQFNASLGYSFVQQTRYRGIAAGRPTRCKNIDAAVDNGPMNLDRGFVVSLMMSPTSGPDSNADNSSGRTSRRSDGGKVFDEISYEKDRLAKDAQAMDAMKALADVELSKEDNNNSSTSSSSSGDGDGELRSPWKWELRKRIWDYMEENDISRFPRPVHHRIPNFVGADQAARRLSEIPEFQSAVIIKVNPDTPQPPVRHFVLQQGKKLLTPQPRLRTGFFSTIEMKELPSLVKIEECTNSKGGVETQI